MKNIIIEVSGYKYILCFSAMELSFSKAHKGQKKPKEQKKNDELGEGYISYLAKQLISAIKGDPLSPAVGPRRSADTLTGCNAPLDPKVSEAFKDPSKAKVIYEAAKIDLKRVFVEKKAFQYDVCQGLFQYPEIASDFFEILKGTGAIPFYHWCHKNNIDLDIMGEVEASQKGNTILCVDTSGSQGREKSTPTTIGKICDTLVSLSAAEHIDFGATCYGQLSVKKHYMPNVKTVDDMTCVLPVESLRELKGEVSPGLRKLFTTRDEMLSAASKGQNDKYVEKMMVLNTKAEALGVRVDYSGPSHPDQMIFALMRATKEGRKLNFIYVILDGLFHHKQGKKSLGAEKKMLKDGSPNPNYGGVLGLKKLLDALRNVDVMKCVFFLTKTADQKFVPAIKNAIGQLSAEMCKKGLGSCVVIDAAESKDPVKEWNMQMPPKRIVPHDPRSHHFTDPKTGNSYKIPVGLTTGELAIVLSYHPETVNAALNLILMKFRQGDWATIVAQSKYALGKLYTALTRILKIDSLNDFPDNLLTEITDFQNEISQIIQRLPEAEKKTLNIFLVSVKEEQEMIAKLTATHNEQSNGEEPIGFLVGTFSEDVIESKRSLSFLIKQSRKINEGMEELIDRISSVEEKDDDAVNVHLPVTEEMLIDSERLEGLMRLVLSPIMDVVFPKKMAFVVSAFIATREAGQMRGQVNPLLQKIAFAFLKRCDFASVLGIANGKINIDPFHNWPPFWNALPIALQFSPTLGHNGEYSDYVKKLYTCFIRMAEQSRIKYGLNKTASFIRCMERKYQVNTGYHLSPQMVFQDPNNPTKGVWVPGEFKVSSDGSWDTMISCKYKMTYKIGILSGNAESNLLYKRYETVDQYKRRFGSSLFRITTAFSNTTNAKTKVVWRTIVEDCEYDATLKSILKTLTKRTNSDGKSITVGDLFNLSGQTFKSGRLRFEDMQELLQEMMDAQVTSPDLSWLEGIEIQVKREENSNVKIQLTLEEVEMIASMIQNTSNIDFKISEEHKGDLHALCGACYLPVDHQSGTYDGISIIHNDCFSGMIGSALEGIPISLPRDHLRRIIPLSIIEKYGSPKALENMILLLKSFRYIVPDIIESLEAIDMKKANAFKTHYVEAKIDKILTAGPSLDQDLEDIRRSMELSKQYYGPCYTCEGGLASLEKRCVELDDPEPQYFTCATCEEKRKQELIRQQLEDKGLDDAKKALITAGGRICPSCKEGTFRVSGCNYVLCTCGHGICWGCGEAIADSEYAAWNVEEHWYGKSPYSDMCKGI